MSITSNKNFVNLYFKLVKEGNIENHKNLIFLIEGYDLPNPHDPNLKEDEKEKIIEKAKSDFWYYMKEVVRIPTIGSRDGVPATINKTNLAVLMGLLDNRNTYSNNPRQLYGTITRCIYVSWLAFKYSDSIEQQILLYSRNKNDNNFFIEKVVLINDMLPNYMKRNYRDIKLIFNTITPLKLDRFISDYIVDDARSSRFPLKGLLIINDLEFCEGLPKLFTNLREKIIDKDIQFTGNGVIGEKGTVGRLAGEKIIEDSSKWEDEYFITLSSVNHTSFDTFYICYDYRELVDSPDEWFEKMTKLFCSDQKMLNREILLIRD